MTRLESVRPVSVELVSKGAAAFLLWEINKQPEREIRKQLDELAGRNGGSSRK